MQVVGHPKMSYNGREHCYLLTHTGNVNKLLVAFNLFLVHYCLYNLHCIIEFLRFIWPRSIFSKMHLTNCHKTPSRKQSWAILAENMSTDSYKNLSEIDHFNTLRFVTHSFKSRMLFSTDSSQIRMQ